MNRLVQRWHTWRDRRARGARAALRWLTASVVRSTAIFVVLSLVPMLLLTYYIIASSLEAAETQAQKSDLQTREFVLALLHTSLAGEANALAEGAEQGAMRRALEQGRERPVTAVLRHLLIRHPEFAAIGFYEPEGLRLGALPAHILPPAVQASAWFRKVENQRQWFVSGLRDLPRLSRPAVLVAAPVRLSHVLQGVIVGALPARVIQNWVGGINRGGDRWIYVLDQNRRLVAWPAHAPLTPMQVRHLPGLSRALGGRSGATGFLRPIALESNIISYAPLANAAEAVLVVRPERLTSYVVRVFYDKLAVIAVIVFVLAVVSGLLLRAAFRYYSQYTREVESGRSKTEALLGNIGDGVFAVDAGLRIIEFNPAAARLTQWPAAEAVGRGYDEVLRWAAESPGGSPPDPVREAIGRRAALRLPRDLRLVRRDGGQLPISISAAPVLDESGESAGVVAVFNDASQEREVDRMKTEFISIASHQLRTPMTGVKGALSLLLEQVLGPLNPQQRDYLRRAYEANERLIALVNDLLNVSRLEQGSLHLRREPLRLDEMARELASEFQPRARRYGQHFDCDMPGPEAWVSGDRVRLREALANLLDNAIKYTPEQGRVSLRLSLEPDAVVLEIADTGVGIAPEQLPRLFQKFSRLENPLSGREFGSGLGLYFARSVIELHQGGITVESQPGAGTRFQVRLPRLADPPRPSPAALSHNTL